MDSVRKNWKNENEWLPVREMEWILEDEGATVLLLGVTARSRQ